MTSPSPVLSRLVEIYGKIGIGIDTFKHSGCILVLWLHQIISILKL